MDRSLATRSETWSLRDPFHISGYTFTAIEVIVATVRQADCSGCGEAAGVYYRGDTPPTMLQQIESVKPAIEAGAGRFDLQGILPPGGARNALDCALWDLESKLTGQPAWDLAGLGTPPRALQTTYTIGAGAPEAMARRAEAFGEARSLKLKLIGDRLDVERLRRVRAARPDVWIGIDANQGLNPQSFAALLPVAVELGVELIEQPFPVGEEALLDGLKCPIPVAADESVQSTRDLKRIVGRFDVVNIKLDKCGGLTEALRMAEEARRMGLKVMVGNMVGTSLAMAPAFLLGQLCDFIDLDGPLLLLDDRWPPVEYHDGFVTCAQTRWGDGKAPRDE